MSDRIELRGLRVLGRHGALEGEQDTAQPFEVDLEVEAELGEAAREDDLTKTVDYSLVVETARSIVSGRRYRLLEALAEAVATGVLEIPGGAGGHGVGAQAPAPRRSRPGSAGVRLRRRAGRRPHEHEVFLGLGSNMGDRMGHLELAVGQLRDIDPA